jgi:hypothetical protein
MPNGGSKQNNRRNSRNPPKVAPKPGPRTDGSGLFVGEQLLEMKLAGPSDVIETPDGALDQLVRTRLGHYAVKRR